MTEQFTIHGGLTSAPEIRYSQSGVAVASGTVASTDRYLDRQTNEWKDGKTLYLRFSAFKDLAENIGASALDKGSQVVVTGKLHTRSYVDGNGQNRSSTELEVIDFAVSLRRAVATVTKTAPAGSVRADRAEAAAFAAGDPWATANVPDDDSQVPF